MGAPAALEADVKDLRAKITATDKEEASLRKAADDLVASKKEAGIKVLEDAEAFAEVDAAYKAADGKKDEAAELRARLTTILGTESAAIIQEAQGDPVKARHLSQRVIDSEAYQILAQSGVLRSSAASVNMAAVEIMDVDEAMAALAPMQFLNAVTDGGPLVPSDRQLVPPIALPTRQVQLLDLITVGSTDSDTVDWTRQTTRNSQAANVAFNTAAPQSNYVWELVTENVKRMAHEATVSRGNLADQRQLRTIIDSELTGDLRRHVEGQVLSGDGTGENVTGIINTAGIATQAKSTDTVPDALHKGITLVRIALEDDITAIGLHPNDYERIVLEKDSQDRYVSGMGWQTSTPRTVWGYPAIVSTIFTEGVAVAGNWARGATLWVREGISVAASSEHSDNFTKGMVTIMAETRAAFAAKQPKAFATVTGLNA
ncbi:MAG: phage major capsid protein [Actinomycetota bacterium]